MPDREKIIKGPESTEERLERLEKKVTEASMHIMRRMANEPKFEQVMAGTQGYYLILEAYAMVKGKDLDSFPGVPSVSTVESMWNWMHDRKEAN